MRLRLGVDEEDDEAPLFGSRKRKRPAKAKKEKAPGKAARAPSKASSAREARERKLADKAFETQMMAAFKESRTTKLADVPAGTARRQLKQPGEEDLVNWSHHLGVAGLAGKDPLLAAAGGDLVSFVFGLEVPGRDLVELNALLDQKAKEKVAADKAEKLNSLLHGGGNSGHAYRASSSSSSGTGKGLESALAGRLVAQDRRLGQRRAAGR